MVSNGVRIGVVAVVAIIALAGVLVIYPNVLTGPPSSGRVLVYGSIDAEDIQSVIEDFERRFPDLTIEYLRGSPSEIYTRVTTELAAGVKSADLTLISFPGTLQLIREDLYRPYLSPEAAAYPSDLKDPDGLWTSVILLGQVITYNTNLVSEDELPRTLSDLTDPKWNGLTTIHDYAKGTTSTQIFASLAEKIGEQKVIQFLRDLEANVQPVIGGSTGAQTDDVARGEYAIGIVAQLHDVIRAKLAGAPVEILQLEDFPLMLAPTTAAILETAENPRGAETFVDFLLSEDAQIAFGNVEVRIPARPGLEGRTRFTIQDSIPEGMEIFRYPTPDVFETVDEWTARFKAIRGV